MSYVQGFVTGVPADARETYRKFAERGAKLFREFGATRIVEAWGDNVPDGKTTDFKKAVQAKPGVVVVFLYTKDTPLKSTAISKAGAMPSLMYTV